MQIDYLQRTSREQVTPENTNQVLAGTVHAYASNSLGLDVPVTGRNFSGARKGMAIEGALALRPLLWST